MINKSKLVGELKEGRSMKTWTKPVMDSVEAGFEISRYLPAILGSCKNAIKAPTKKSK